jgi:histidinol-phosphate aminotransferase
VSPTPIEGLPAGVRVRPHVESLDVYVPGRSSGVPEGVPQVKLSSNEGAEPPVPEALAVLERDAAGFFRYPDPHDLVEALADRAGLPMAQVTVGPGADALLGYLAQAMLGPGDEVVFGWPSFVSYALTAQKQQATAIMVPLRDDAYDLDAMLAAITPATRLVYVCNPNNPTGTYVGRDALAAFVADLPEHVVCVVDEAYHEYVLEPDYPDALVEHVRAGNPRVAVLRTFSKIHGLAGLRCGWMAGPSWLLDAIGRVRGPFDVNAAAIAAALASLGRPEAIERRARENAARRESLRAALAEAGVTRMTGSANFLCVEVGDAQAASAALLEQGVIVRPLGAFGAPSKIRVTIGSDEDMARAQPILVDVLGGLVG